MNICYIEKKFSADKLKKIAKANQIIKEYQNQGFDLTLRQLYYQFVARDLIPNSVREYKNLGSLINDARLAGEISWEAIIDRTRNLVQNSHWGGPRDIVEACAKQFQIDKWSDQDFRVEVWIEKDALVGVIEKTCQRLDVPYFSCRGYTSQSEMWSAAMRLQKFAEDHNQTPVIIHLGDHDPSGIDMTRDIDDRLALFMGGMEINRIALNGDQIEKFKPPPNPAKVTDPRARGYIAKFGRESWELDALDPKVIDQLINKTVLKFRDEERWESAVEMEREHRETLLKAAKKMA